MTHFPDRPIADKRGAAAPAPEHPWVSESSTLNPSPGPLQKQRRDTAEGCRDRATADLLEAVTMSTVHSRKMLERSSAAWGARALMLQCIETSIETKQADFPLTAEEIAEDSAHIRL